MGSLVSGRAFVLRAVLMVLLGPISSCVKMIVLDDDLISKKAHYNPYVIVEAYYIGCN